MADGGPLTLTNSHCLISQVEYYNEYLKTCLANLHGAPVGAAEERGKRVRFHRIGGGGRRGRTSASSLASSRGERFF